MRDVLVIGGGLTGLAACYQLEKLGLRYTVVELRRRFGGEIRSISRAGFIMDASAFACESLADAPWQNALGLSERILRLEDDSWIFGRGTESLIRALADSLQGGRLMRMAVSSIGRLGSRFTICLENGMMFDAGAIILAAPARFAARMLYNLAPEASERLLDISAEPLWQVALGLHKRDLPADLSKADLAFLRMTDLPPRVPDATHILIQLGLSADPAERPPAIVSRAAESLGISAAPIAAHAQVSCARFSVPEADHAENLSLIHVLLPAGISLVGSEYLARPPKQPDLAQLAERMRAGQDAALQAAKFLKARKPS